MNDQAWLIDLIGEYTKSDGTPPRKDQIRRLAEAYSAVSPVILRLATIDYIRRGRPYFPRVGEFGQAVELARGLFATRIRPDLLTDQDRADLEVAYYDADPDINPDQADQERAQAGRLLDGWGRCPYCHGQLNSFGQCYRALCIERDRANGAHTTNNKLDKQPAPMGGRQPTGAQ